MRKIYQALSTIQKPMQAIIICGNNKELRVEMSQLAQNSAMPTVAVASISMCNAMHACDLLVTKAGGLTTFEAVACQLPLAIDMITEPMPQELGTAEMLIDAGLAQPVYRPSDIIAIAESIEHLDAAQKKPVKSA